MGFEIARVAVLEFQPGTLLDGATVRVSLDMQIREAFALQGIGNAIREHGEASNEAIALSEQAFREFGENVLVGWDLERNGEPIPANGEGMLSLPIAHALELFNVWAKSIGAISGNSIAAFANGNTSEAASGLTVVA